MERFLAQDYLHRRLLPETETTVWQIRQALFSFLGIAESQEKNLDTQIRQFGRRLDGGISDMGTGLQMTKAESDAWIKAKMPSPPEAWLKEYRRERR